MRSAFVLVLCVAAVLLGSQAMAHGAAPEDQSFLQNASGLHLLPFMDLRAKHMVTGYDHPLFLLGVIFFLYLLREVALHVTLFAVGHSVTLSYGVLSGMKSIRIRSTPSSASRWSSRTMIFVAMRRCRAARRRTVRSSRRSPACMAGIGAISAIRR